MRLIELMDSGPCRKPISCRQLNHAGNCRAKDPAPRKPFWILRRNYASCQVLVKPLSAIYFQEKLLAMLNLNLWLERICSRKALRQKPGINLQGTNHCYLKRSEDEATAKRIQRNCSKVEICQCCGGTALRLAIAASKSANYVRRFLSSSSGMIRHRRPFWLPTLFRNRRQLLKLTIWYRHWVKLRWVMALRALLIRSGKSVSDSRVTNSGQSRDRARSKSIERSGHDSQWLQNAVTNYSFVAPVKKMDNDTSSGIAEARDRFLFPADFAEKLTSLKNLRHIPSNLQEQSTNQICVKIFLLLPSTCLSIETIYK